MRRIEKIRGYDMEIVLDSMFCYKLLNALGYAASLVEEHPKLNHQPFHNSTSGTKVVISSDFTKQIACFYQCDSCNFLVDFL